jgi:hypothetical protein
MGYQNADHDLGMKWPQVNGIILMQREVQVFRWKETSKEIEQNLGPNKVRKGRVYEYTAGWGDHIDSSKFNDVTNKGANIAPAFPNCTFEQPSFHIGNTEVHKDYVKKLFEQENNSSGWQKLNLTQATFTGHQFLKRGTWQATDDFTLENRC